MQTEDQPAGLPAIVRDPIGTVRRRWVGMLAAVTIGMIASVIYVFTTIPITYLAETTVLVSSQGIPERFVVATVTTAPLDRINALIGELLSRSRLLSIIEKHDPYAEFPDLEPSARVDIMRDNISVTTKAGMGQGRRAEASNSLIFNIAFRHSDAEIAAAVANDLASLFVG